MMRQCLRQLLPRQSLPWQVDPIVWAGQPARVKEGLIDLSGERVNRRMDEAADE